MIEPLEGAPSRGSWEDIPSCRGARLKCLGARRLRHVSHPRPASRILLPKPQLRVQLILFILSIRKIHRRHRGLHGTSTVRLTDRHGSEPGLDFNARAAHPRGFAGVHRHARLGSAGGTSYAHHSDAFGADVPNGSGRPASRDGCGRNIPPTLARGGAVVRPAPLAPLCYHRSSVCPGMATGGTGNGAFQSSFSGIRFSSEFRAASQVTSLPV